MSSIFKGKVALVTGGSRGLGATTAEALADQGARVAISYVASAEKAEAVVEKLHVIQPGTMRPGMGDCAPRSSNLPISCGEALGSRMPRQTEWAQISHHDKSGNRNDQRFWCEVDCR